MKKTFLFLLLYLLISLQCFSQYEQIYPLINNPFKSLTFKLEFDQKIPKIQLKDLKPYLKNDSKTKSFLKMNQDTLWVRYRNDSLDLEYDVIFFTSADKNTIFCKYANFILKKNIDFYGDSYMFSEDSHRFDEEFRELAFELIDNDDTTDLKSGNYSEIISEEVLEERLNLKNHNRTGTNQNETIKYSSKELNTFLAYINTPGKIYQHPGNMYANDKEYNDTLKVFSNNQLVCKFLINWDIDETMFIIINYKGNEETRSYYHYEGNIFTQHRHSENPVLQKGRQIAKSIYWKHYYLYELIIETQKYEFEHQGYTTYFDHMPFSSKQIAVLNENKKVELKDTVADFLHILDNNTLRHFFERELDFESVLFQDQDSMVLHFNNKLFDYTYDLGIKAYNTDKPFYIFTFKNLAINEKTKKQNRDYHDAHYQMVGYNWGQKEESLSLIIPDDTLKAVFNFDYDEGYYQGNNREHKVSKLELDTILSCFADSAILNSNLSSVYECDFIPYEIYKFYKKKKLIGSIEICFNCNEVVINRLPPLKPKHYAFNNLKRSNNKRLMKSEQKNHTTSYEENLNKMYIQMQQSKDGCMKIINSF